MRMENDSGCSSRITNPQVGEYYAGLQILRSGGLVLSQNGGMGQQGDPTTSSSNLWYGTWTGGVHTYVDGSSDAANSKLFIKSCGTCSPTMHGGLFSTKSYSHAGNLVLVNTGAGDHNCFNEPNGIATPFPNDEDYYTEGMAYIAKTANYRFLHFNDSILASDAIHSGFYNDLESSSIDKFMQIEQLLHDGNYSAALTILAAIEPTVNVESNYVSYYTVYANYLSGQGILSTDDSIALYELCFLCPGFDGACVYQARSLYNSIYQVMLEGGDCSGEEYSARKANVEPIESIKFNGSDKKWDVAIFPNPATEQLIIYTTVSAERIFIAIYDITGRVVQKEKLQLSDHHCNMKFNLDNGVYFLSVTNIGNETITKKIIVSK
jgi:hypothetical protein